MNTQKEFGKIIKSLIQKTHSSSNKAFGELIKVSDVTVGQYLKGEGNPKLNVLVNISRECKVPINEVVPGCESPKFTSPPTQLSTNRHMEEISAWVNTQDDPKGMWAWISGEIKRKQPDFTEYLKKRNREDIPDTGSQSNTMAQ